MRIPKVTIRSGSIGLRIIAPAMAVVILLVVSLAWVQLVQLSESRRDTLDAYAKLVGRMIFGQLRDAMQANDQQRIQAQIAKLVELGPIRGVQVVAKDGRIVFASDRRTVGTTVAFDSQSCQACHGEGKAATTDERSIRISADPPTVRAVQSIVIEAACQRCHDADVGAPIATLFTDLDEDVLTGGAKAKASRTVWLTSGIAALLLIVLLVTVRRLVVARVFGLRRLMDHIRSGVRSNLVVTGRPQDEIDDLARSLQAFTLDLDEQVAIQRALASFSGVLMRHPAPVWLLDATGRILLVNRHTADRFGFLRYSDYAGRNRGDFAESPSDLMPAAHEVGWALPAHGNAGPCIVALSDALGEVLGFMEVWPEIASAEPANAHNDDESSPRTGDEYRNVLPAAEDTEWAAFVSALLEQVRPGTRPWRGVVGFDRNLARARSLSVEVGRTAVSLRQVSEVQLQDILALAAIDAEKNQKERPEFHFLVKRSEFVMGSRYQLRALFSSMIRTAAKQAGSQGHVIIFTQPGHDEKTIFIGAWADKPGLGIEAIDRPNLARAAARAHGGDIEIDPKFDISEVAATRGLRVPTSPVGSLFVAKISLFGRPG